MDVAVHREAAGLAPYPSHGRSLDTTRYDSHAHFSDEMLPRDVDDSESDGSARDGGKLTRSTSATTDDVFRSRPPPPPRYSTTPDRVSLWKSTSASPLTSSPASHPNLGHHRLKAPPPPPHPPPPFPPEDLRRSRQQAPRAIHPHPPPAHPHPSLPPPPGQTRVAVLRSDKQTNHNFHHHPPPPPPPPQSSAPPPRLDNGEPPRFRPEMPSGPPPPPYHSVPSQFPDVAPIRGRNAMQTQSRIPPAPRPHPKQAPSNTSNISPSNKRSYHTRPRQRRSELSRSRHSFQEDPYHDQSDSSTYSHTRPTDSDSAISETSSEEDPIAYLNDRQFPPLLPADSHVRMFGPKSKAAITNRITSWVAQYERSQSPWRGPRGDGVTSAESKITDAKEEKSEASETSSDGEPEHLWTQLKKKRATLNTLKRQMAEKRKELRELRRKKDDADGAFMNVIRPILVNQRSLSHTPSSLLDRRMLEMQRLRTDYYYLESKYEGLEVILDEEEVSLNKLETRFFSLLAAGRMRTEKAPVSHDDVEQEEDAGFHNMPVILKGISSEGPPENIHPLYVELISALGDLQNATEEYDDLLYVKSEYDYDAELKRKTGQKHDDSDSKEFFADFPKENARMLKSIEHLNETVEKLKQECEAKGVMRKHLSSKTAYLLYPDKPYEDIELDDVEQILERSPSLAHASFPILLTQPDHVLANEWPQTSSSALKTALRLPSDDPSKQSKIQLAVKECTIDRLSQDYEHGEGEGKDDFVNGWLLQQLRMSPLNAHLLQSIFTESLAIRDSRRWQGDVLRHWWRDTSITLAGTSNVGRSTKQSEYASRVGTPQISRAASDKAGATFFRYDDKTTGSDAQTIYEEPVFPNSYPTPTGATRSPYFS